MMNSLLLTSQGLFVYSISLSVQLLLIMLIRKPVARWFGTVNAYWLWLLPLVWLPFQWLKMPIIEWQAIGSLLPFETSPNSQLQAIVSWFPLALESMSFELELASPELLEPSSTSHVLWSAVAIIWVTGLVVLVGYQLYRISIFSHQLKLVAVPANSVLQKIVASDIRLASRVKVVSMDGVSSPALFGIFRPLLLLPRDFAARFSSAQRQLILAHEAIHMMRYDNLWNLLLTCVRILFWFNPLVHMAWSRFRLDQEMSCDALALASVQENQALLYARTLLESTGNLFTSRPQPTLIAWGNLREIRERTQMIKLHTKHPPLQGPGRWLLLLLVILGCQGISVVSVAQQAPVPAANTGQADTQVLSRDVNARIAQIMALRDQGDLAGAQTLLDTLNTQQAAGELDSRETYRVWQFAANLALASEDYQAALRYYLQIMDMPDLERTEKNQTLQKIGSLYFITEQYEEALAILLENLALLDSLPASTTLDMVKNQIQMRIAQAYYQLKEYAQAAVHAELAVAADPSRRSSYTFLRNLYLQNADIAAATDITRSMLARFDDQKDRELLERLEAGDNTVLNADQVMATSEAEYLPILTMQPQYPASAIQQGIEGWAQVKFDVDEQGKVINPSVVDSSPEAVFDQTSLDAIAGFRFTPRIEAGTPVTTRGVQYVFRYNMK